MNWDLLVQWGEWFIIAVLGAGIVKLMDLSVERFRQRQQFKKEMVKKLDKHLNEFAELAELYRFFARTESHLIKNKKGEFVKDESGTYVVEHHILEPELRFEQAIKSLKGTDLSSVITQKVVEIHLNSGEVLDFALELDPSGELKEKLGQLYWLTNNTLKFWIDHKDYEQMVSALLEANQARREIRSMLQKYRR